jgi:3-oxoadipate enol-lactonase
MEPAEAARRRSRQLALSLLELGEGPDEVERQLMRWRYHPALARESLCSEDHRVLALDHRGHGRGIRSRLPFRLEDCADDAAALVREMRLGRTTAVGYSMGGPIAQLMWRRHPETVAGLVLCATAARFPVRRFNGPFGTLGVGAAASLSLMPTLLRRRGMEYATSRWTAREGAALWAATEWGRHDPTALVQAGVALSRFDSTGWIGRIDVPTAVVVTERDLTVSPRRQWYLAETIPGAVAFPVDGDHRVVVDHPDRFLPAFRSACDEVRRLSQTTPA